MRHKCWNMCMHADGIYSNQLTNLFSTFVWKEGVFFGFLLVAQLLPFFSSRQFSFYPNAWQSCYNSEQVFIHLTTRILYYRDTVGWGVGWHPSNIFLRATLDISMDKNVFTFVVLKCANATRTTSCCDPNCHIDIVIRCCCWCFCNTEYHNDNVY